MPDLASLVLMLPVIVAIALWLDRRDRRRRGAKDRPAKKWWGQR